MKSHIGDQNKITMKVWETKQNTKLILWPKWNLPQSLRTKMRFSTFI